MAYDYERLRLQVEHGVAFATIASPPLNVMTLALFGELARFSLEVSADRAVSAVVLRSDDPYTARLRDIVPQTMAVVDEQYAVAFKAEPYLVLESRR